MSFGHMGFPQLCNSKKVLKEWSSNWRSSRHPLKCILQMDFPKGGFVGFHLRGNGMHFGNGIHHP
jgi:hypothetical protein